MRRNPLRRPVWASRSRRAEQCDPIASVREPGSPVSARREAVELTLASEFLGKSRWHHERPLVLLARGLIH